MTRTFRIVGGLALLAAGGLGLAAPQASAREPKCPRHLKQRTAEETIREHLALLQAGNIDLAMCDYADDALVILPGQVISGLDNIRGGLSAIGSLLGGAVPQIQTLTATSDTVLITFTAFGTPCTIPDGSDTYIVKKGRIVTQTVHDTLRSAPGFVCPAAAPGT